MKKHYIIMLMITLVLALTSCQTVLDSFLGNNTEDSASNNTNTGNDETKKTEVEDVQYTWATFSNPTLVTYDNGSSYSTEVADPSIVRGDDGYFYIFSTMGRVLRSEDACNWIVYSNSILPRPTWELEVYEKPVNAQIWAPDVVKVGDQWIYYYSLSAWGACCGVGYAIADEITGPYTDMGKLFDYKEIGIQNAIDPQVYIDDDGSVYMAVGSFQGLYLLELTEDGMGLMNGVEYQNKNKVLIAGKVGGWDGSTYEGSYIVQKDGYYYYFGSAGTCCEGRNSTYRVVVGRAETITGPYVDKKGRQLTMSGGGTTFGEICVMTTVSNENVAAPGHNSILIDDAGDYWIYYHAYSSKDNFGTRHLFMDKLAWDDEGFPYVSYEYENDEGIIKQSKFKPSFDMELDGPRFILN